MNGFDDWPTGPPLDIQKVARALLDVWRDGMMELEKYNGEAVYVPFGVERNVYERMMIVLTMYDQHRTEQIEWLRKELVRMHNTSVCPTFYMMKKEGTTP